MAPPKMGMSAKRIGKELKEIEKELPDGIRAGLKNNDNLFEWYAQVRGPTDSPYEGGVFDIDISIPPDYPFRPPRAQFKTKVYHMNINKDGGICLDILKNQWSPALSVLKVILSILSLLTDPNPADPLVGEIARMYTQNRALHDMTARDYTKQHAKPANAWPPVGADEEAATTAQTAAAALAANEKAKAKEKDAPRPKAIVRTDRPIVIDGDEADDEVQLVGTKRANPSDSGASTRNTRARTSTSNTSNSGSANASGSAASGSNAVIELD